MLAVKTFKPGKEGDGVSPTAIREIMLLREISHENIVRLDSVHLNRQEPCLSLAFDYAEHDLYEMIKFHRDKVHGPIDLYTVKSLMWQVLNGLSVMHQNWIIHRDMKPSNVLVMGEGEEQGRVKIADFGLARFFQAPLRPLSDNGVVVTIWYRSPELLLGAKHYTVAVDMWAAGCIFAELLTLRPLFQGEEKKQPGNAFQADQLDKIFRILGHPNTQAWPELENLQHWRDNTENVRVRKTWHPEAHVGQEQRLEEYLAEHSGLRRALRGSPAVDLLMRMVDYNPLTRITAAEALEHEWFRQDPLFGANSFVHRGRAVVQYPRRVKYSSTAPNVPVHPTTSTAAEAGGTQSAIPSQGVITGSSRGGETAAGVPARVRSRPDLEKFVKPGKRKHDFGPGFR
ncbi:hypothetical protein WJX72_002988 [[Myrmecia] bisecta]|uniref:Protein kinase domain-containing protein n=1 Tax=[Myrmecia] bisecta TaxID=41462 RepID=A0AAW1PWH6_9CHLO